MEILLVEDNPGDVRLAREGLCSTTSWNHLNVAKDGVEAIAYLRRDGEFAEVIRPDLILLDLNLPKKDGREVLSEIKADAELKTIPVVVLTTSTAEEDISKAYQLGANSYITKPADFQQSMDVFKAIHDFWFSLVKLPPVS